MSVLAARSWSWRISAGMEAVELLAPAGPRERLVVQEQQGAGGVALRRGGDLGLEVQHDALVAEADAEVLKAPVPTPGLRQDVVQLVAVHRGDVTGRAPVSLPGDGLMIVIEPHQ